MTSNEIIEKLRKLQYILNENESFFEVIRNLSNFYPTLAQYLDEIIDNDFEKIDYKGSRQHHFSSKISAYLSNLKIGTVFIELQKMIDEISKLNTELSNANFPFPLLIDKLRKLFILFEESFGNYGFKNTFALAQLASSITDIVENIRNLTYFLNESTQPAIKLQNDESELSFYFTTSTEYKDLIIKLTALEQLYNEICRLLNVSTSQFPLRLVKLETGSWWIKVFGESKVITAIIGFAEKSVSWFHQNYTVDGKISKIPKDLEVIDRMLELSKSLEENGIDATVLKNNLQHSAIVLSEQLNKLLVGEPNVKINEKEFYIGKDLDEKLLKERQTLLLESGESET
jgi:hypothetical protein